MPLQSLYNGNIAGWMCGSYDATGNLTQDVSENIQTGGISWTPYNKIDRIVKLTSGGAQIMKLAYLYDASGNRVIEDHFASDTSSSPTRTYYVRDAQGNVMGIFKRASGETYAERQETPIYGSSRLGVSYKGALHTAVATDTLAHYNTLYTRELRLRGYELTDHLGNVRATVSDMLLPRTGNDFDADLRTLTDYYPFGMTLPGRSYTATGLDAHRYGYNGKENDNEVKGEGNQQDYGFRIYDPRVARFLSVDPLAPDYPGESPFQFALLDPLSNIEIQGLGPKDRVKYARSFIGTTYKQESPRSGWTFGALKTIDCSELVMRVLCLDRHLVDKPITTAGLKHRFTTDSDTWIKSDQPQIGDVVLWRNEKEGHTAIVSAIREIPIFSLVPRVDSDGQIVKNKQGKVVRDRVVTGSELQYKIIHAIGENKGTAESSWLPIGRGSSKPLVGYFRPKSDTPDILPETESVLAPMQYYDMPANELPSSAPASHVE